MRLIACKKCDETKMESQFYLNSATSKRDTTCKECVKARVRQYRADNLESVRAYDRERGQLEHRKEANRARSHLYNNRPAKPWRGRNIEKYRAHVAVNNAVRDGRLAKKDRCERCNGTYALQGHHDDYSKPLDVQWLCRHCHGERHRELNAERRAMSCEAAE